MKITPHFFVLEGLDGSGKTTQIELLTQYYKTQAIPFETIHFPRLGAGYYGDLIAAYLRGAWKTFGSIPPKVLALLFAGDRQEHIHLINNWLAEGKIVLADRYVYSNIAYQSAKCQDLKAKLELKKWIIDFEYGYHALPRPRLSIYLDVPFSSIKKNLKIQRQGADRAYLKDKKDVHEADLSLQERVHNEFLNLVKTEGDFYKVKCYGKDNHFLNTKSINLAIRKVLAAAI